MCCTRLAGNTRCKKLPSAHHRTTLSGYMLATEARIDNLKKNLLNSNISPTCPYNMVNFGLVTAEICWRVWGTPANFNRFRFLAALLHGTLVMGVRQTAALNRGRHLYSARRPSRWALAHILLILVVTVLTVVGLGWRHSCHCWEDDVWPATAWTWTSNIWWPTQEWRAQKVYMLITLCFKKGFQHF